MKQLLPDQLNTGLHQVAQVCRTVVCLASLATALVGHALQQGQANADDLATPQTTTTIVSPTYLEKSTGDPNSLHQEQGWQVGGLNTRFSTNVGSSMLNFSGGLFYSRELLPNKSLDASANAFANANGMNFNNSTGFGFANNLLQTNQAIAGKSDQVFFQQLHYQAGGFNFSGSYSNVGKDFQGISDLTKQMSADDAKLLALGMTQTNYALSYTGIRGLELTSSRSIAENGKNGDKEYGLTRTVQSNRLAMALGQHHRLEYTIANTLEDWDPEKKTQDPREIQTQTLKLSGSLGQKSSFSLGQTLASTLVGGTQSADSKQRDLAVSWNDWRNFALNGGYTTKLNALNGEKNNVLSLDMNTALSPRFQLAGKLIENTTEKPNNTQDIENDLLNLSLTSNLAKNLQLVTGYQDSNTPDKGEVVTRDQRVVWKPSTQWQLTSHLMDVDSSKDTSGSVTEHTLVGQIGAKSHAEQMTIFTRNESLVGDVTQDRNEITYTRALGTGNAATLLLQGGSYAREHDSEAYQRDLLAVQLLNMPASKQTAVSVGYYEGPRLGAGYLNYRTWGQRNSNNLGVWSAQDFNSYHEVGGEVSHRLSAATRLTFRQMQGELQDVGEQAMVEYGVEHKIGTLTMQGTHRYTMSAGKDGNQVTDDVTLWKLAMPGKKALPEWAANSMRNGVFQDNATWGFGRAQSWESARATSGFSLEKKLGPASGKAVDQYNTQAATMLSDTLFAQVGYESNPQTAGKTDQVDTVKRGYLHLSYQAKPNMQLFGRYAEEEWQTKTAEQRTISFGVTGKLSSVERLQFQIDAQTREDGNNSLTGNYYSLEFERNVSADDSLTLKIMVNPEEFTAVKDAMRVEATYNRTF